METVTSRIARLKEERRLLQEEWDVVDGLILSGDPVDRPRRNVRLAQIETRLDQISAEIKQLEEGAVSERLLAEREQDMLSRWEKLKHTIDFQQSFRRFMRVINGFANDGAVLFLLPEGRDRLAGFYLTRVEEWLSDGFPKVTLFPYQFDSGDSVSCDVLLGRLGQWLGMSTPYEVEKVIDKLLLERLEAGSIFYLRLELNRTVPAVFFETFLHDFWNPLITRLQQVTLAKPGIRMLAFLAIRLKMPTDVPPSALCSPPPPPDALRDRFNILLLDQWQRDDVRDWLMDELRPTRYDLQLTVVDDLVEGAFDAPRMPFDIFARLDQDWKEIVARRMEELRHAQLAAVSVSQ